MKNKEIEIQVELQNIKPLRDFLEERGKFLYESHQIDEYYTPAHRDFAAKKPVSEWLRIRREDQKPSSITYKKWHYDADGRNMCFCDEYETEIGDGGQMQKIFEALDLKRVTRVDKKRRCYTFKDYEIAIDEVKNLGSFVELEYKSEKEAEPDQIIKEMVSFLKTLNVGKILKNEVGYAYQCMFPNEVIKKYQY